jgi:hypothetical protein
MLGCMARISAAYTERAIGKLQRKETQYNVAAVFAGEVTREGFDGTRWRFVVTDGSTVGEFEAGISRTQGVPPGMDEPALERLVEREAGRFPVETRLQDLLEASPLLLG